MLAFDNVEVEKELYLLPASLSHERSLSRDNDEQVTCT